MEHKVSFKRSVTRGAETIEFGCEMAVSVPDGDKPQPYLNIRLNEAIRYVQGAIASYIEANPRYPELKAPAPAASTPAAEIDIMPCGRLEVIIKGGVKQYKLYGGQYSEYGVPIYKDTVKQLPFELPDNDVNFTEGKWSAKVQMVGGKAKRVLEIYLNG